MRSPDRVVRRPRGGRGAGSVRAVAGTLTEIVETERRFPPRVEQVLTSRHDAARRRAAGSGVDVRVLDLDDPAARIVLVDTIDRGSDDAVVPEWDAVVSVAQLIRFPDLGAALQAVDRLLRPTGRLFAVEPVSRPGTAGLFLAAPFAAARATRRFHVGRDLPAALRTTTLVIDDIERMTVRTALPILRHFVSVVARRAEPPQEGP